MSTPNYDQIAFDMAFTHLAQQGKQATDGNRCRYRSDDGCKCAIGSLVSDDDYTSAMENEGYSNPAVVAAVKSTVGGPVRYCLLANMQNAHDCIGPHGWRAEALTLAKTHNLSTATIDALDWSACEATP